MSKAGCKKGFNGQKAKEANEQKLKVYLAKINANNK